MKRATVSHRDWIVKKLKSDPKFAAEYLAAASEDEDPRVYLIALRNVAEAQGMAKVARAAGLPRESLYRALLPKGNPRWDTLAAILRATGLCITPRKAA